MKVRMLIDVSGTRDGADWPKRGETADFPDGAALVAAGMAVAVDDDEPETEAAVDETPVEAAVADTKPAARKRTAAQK